MSFETRLRVLVCSQGLQAETQEARHLQAVLDELKKMDYNLVAALQVSDAATAIQSDAALGCLLLEWGEGEWRQDIDALIHHIRGRGMEAPIFLLVGRHLLQDVPVEILDHITGCVFAAEDLPDFIAKNLASHIKIYADTLRTPFFGAMLDYAKGRQPDVDLSRP